MSETQDQVPDTVRDSLSSRAEVEAEVEAPVEEGGIQVALHTPTVSRPTSTTADLALHSTDTPQGQSALNELRIRLRKVEQLASASQNLSKTPDKNLTQAIQDLSGRLSSIEKQLASLPIQQDKSLTSHPNTDGPTLSVEPTVSRLRITADKTKLFGPSHWVHTAEKFKLIGAFDEKEVEPSFLKQDTGYKVNAIRYLRSSIKKRESVVLNDPVPDILATIPSKEICDKLVALYLRTFEPIYRILHVPTFWDTYDKFWEDQETSPFDFRIKLVLILAVGTTFYPDRVEHQRLRRLAQTWVYSAQWWLVGPTEKTTYHLGGLQVACLLHLARQTNSLRTASWMTMGTVVRMAMFMGLHRDPDNFPALSPFEAEMRRRLWASVLELTILPALDSGVPLILTLDHYDTKSPSNLNDKDLDPESKAPFTPKPDHVVTDTSIQRLLLKSVPLRFRVTNTIDKFSENQRYDAAINMGTELRSTCREFATFFHSAKKGDGVLGPSDFHRDFIDMYLRRYILFLHRPFIIQARKDPRFYMARKVCLESAMVIASYAGGMNLTSGDVDDLSRFFIAAGGSLRGPLSLDVITMLGLELITQLEEEGVDSSGTNDPLDKMAKITRAPLIQALKDINAKLQQLVILGSPSLKRYGFLSVMLSQICATEEGRPVKPAVYKALHDWLDECCSLLETSKSDATPQDSIETLTFGGSSTTTAVEMPFGNDFEGMIDPNLSLDLTSWLFFAGMGDGNLASGSVFQNIEVADQPGSTSTCDVMTDVSVDGGDFGSTIMKVLSPGDNQAFFEFTNNVYIFIA
ncbi:Transcription factor lepE-like protein [Cladobotryum mycophilum]|uniref:Transcription factor lepE-like protein n=1 Tax=Cladobotryum mycophilum TaxID=491253 RepID=A0ABR0SYA6_9HYPO